MASDEMVEHMNHPRNKGAHPILLQYLTPLLYQYICILLLLGRIYNDMRAHRNPVTMGCQWEIIMNRNAPYLFDIHHAYATHPFHMAFCKVLGLDLSHYEAQCASMLRQIRRGGGLTLWHLRFVTMGHINEGKLMLLHQMFSNIGLDETH
jgi:hypothetical protein